MDIEAKQHRKKNGYTLEELNAYLDDVIADIKNGRFLRQKN